MADRNAFPALMTVNAPGGGVSQSDARDLIALLETVPRFIAEHRLPLLRERRTRVPCGRLVWRDPDSMIAIEYDGMEAALRAAEAAPDDDDYDHDDDHDDASDDADDDAFADEELNVQAELQRAVQEVAEQLGPGADADAVLRALNQRMSARMNVYNEQPQADLGNLSPVQVQQLLSADWSDAQGAVRLRRDLPLEALESASLFVNTRLLLGMAEQSAGLLATQNGNLRVAIVRKLLDRLHFRDAGHGAILLEQKRLTETDVWPLHMARVLAGLAGLLQRRKGRFTITQKGRKLLRNDRAGELFALLFQTCFRELNLAYLAPFGPNWPELQRQIAFTLYRLGQASSAWASARDLLPDVVLPFAPRLP